MNLNVDRELLSPEHRKKLDIRLWLYLYILMILPPGSDTINDWDDEYASKTLGVTLTTIVRQKKQLELDGYIINDFENSQVFVLPLRSEISVRDRLEKIGVDQGPIHYIVSRYSEDFIQKHLDWYELSSGNRNPGWLVNNIVKNRTPWEKSSS